MRGYLDSDFVGDQDTRRSVSGFVIYLNDAPINWRSKSQKSVTLSSTEAEYVAVSELSMEILFAAKTVEFLGMEVNYPIEVFVDNIGAIFLSKTAKTNNHTKHIDTRYHFVREYIEKGVLKVIFVKSKDNVADFMTKNLPKQDFVRHVENLKLKNCALG